MAARYLIRFDDVCPTMNWDVWHRVETILDRYGIRPIVAVVPDNRDSKLAVAKSAADFWERVRAWQDRQWVIGWHGYQHTYVNGNAGIVGIHRQSEFAGVEKNQQREKLAAAAEIFRANGIQPGIWVAPGHSFDSVTVELLPEFGITRISDGFTWRVVLRQGCFWVPQQLWRFRRIPFGVWTICMHINTWRNEQVLKFESDIREFQTQIISVDDLRLEFTPNAGWADSVFNRLYRQGVLIRGRVQRADIE